MRVSRKWLVVLFAWLLLPALILPTSASAATKTRVRVTIGAYRVTEGQVQPITARVRGKPVRSCKAKVVGPKKQKVNLGKAPLAVGVATWTFDTTGRRLGKWTVTVTCGKARKSKTFRIVARSVTPVVTPPTTAIGHITVNSDLTEWWPDGATDHEVRQCTADFRLKTDGPGAYSIDAGGEATIRCTKNWVHTSSCQVVTRTWDSGVVPVSNDPQNEVDGADVDIWPQRKPDLGLEHRHPDPEVFLFIQVLNRTPAFWRDESLCGTPSVKEGSETLADPFWIEGIDARGGGFINGSYMNGPEPTGALTLDSMGNPQYASFDATYEENGPVYTWKWTQSGEVRFERTAD